MTRLFRFLILFIPLAVFPQATDLFATDGVATGLHQSNVGKIIFTDGNIPLPELKASDFLKSFELTYRSDLNIRVFMDNSVANYLHKLAPDLTTKELMSSGNLQFAFFIDDKLVYTENIHHGCGFGSGGNKNTSTTFRVPLTSTKGEDWWAIYMWDRFKDNGGEKAFTPGKHLLGIELRPYITTGNTVKVGGVIAKGQLPLIIMKPDITAKDVAVQPVVPGSGWEISKLPVSSKTIEKLNTEIALHHLKEITSVVAVYDGKLLLEEYFNGADRNTLHDTRSAGKSFTSTLMGMAIDDGYIKDENERLGTFYDLKKYANYDMAKERVTISDLLTMSSAFNGSDADSNSPGNEENMYPTDNWVRFGLDLPIDGARVNNRQWQYFTAGVVLLGDILNQSVPGGLETYADKKLFRPLGIKNYKWQYTPQNLPNTAGSLQMTSLDYAKYAQLYKNKGMWNGNQILPHEWVSKTLSRQIAINGRENQFYGFLFWNKELISNGLKYEIYYCAGNGGNQFIVFQDVPLVVVITSKAYNKPYGHTQTELIITQYILPAILK